MKLLNKINDLFVRVKKNEDELLDTLTEIDGHLRKLDRKMLHEDMDGICKRIRDCAHKLLPMDAFDDSLHPSSSSVQHKNHLLDQDLYLLQKRYRELKYHPPSLCLMYLVIFPKDAVLKKSYTIYRWIGDGYIGKTKEKTAEEVGEEVIDELLKLNMIVPYGNTKCPLVNKFQIHPHIHPLLESSFSPYKKNAHHLGYYLGLTRLVLEKQKVMLGDGVGLIPADSRWRIFNIGANYLNFQSQWLSKSKRVSLKMLQCNLVVGKIHLHITLKWGVKNS